MRSLLIVLVVAHLLISGCSSCESQVVGRYHNGATTYATLLTRECGSAEGWVIELELASGAKAEVLHIKMPPPTSVRDVGEYVTLVWQDRDTLKVSAPRWVTMLDRPGKFDHVSIVFVATDKPYPKESS